MELTSTGPMISCCYNGTCWKKLCLGGAIDNQSREENRTMTASPMRWSNWGAEIPSYLSLSLGI